MSRLLYITIFTGQFEAMKEFYGRRVGLSVRVSEPGWAEFDTGSAVLALHEMDDDARQGIALRFEAVRIERRRQAMAKRGVDFMGDVQHFPWGSFSAFWDTEGNPAGLLQTPEDVPAKGAATIDTVILSCRQFATTAEFYRERVGLPVSNETDRFVEFNTGETKLVVHPRYNEVDLPPHAEQNVAVSFLTDDLLKWVEDMRRRGVKFAAAPMEEVFGTYAEVEDPDGYVVVFREPPAEPSREDLLAEAYEDGSPSRAAIRKPPQKGSRASILIARPGAGTRKRVRKKSGRTVVSRNGSGSKRGLQVAAPRGTGSAGTRRKPKSQKDPKRAKAKPALGSLKRAGQLSLSRRKRAVATSSKTRPVKRAAARGRVARTGAAKRRASARTRRPARAGGRR